MALTTTEAEELQLHEEEDNESDESEEDATTLHPSRISYVERSRLAKKRKRQAIVILALLFAVIVVVITLLILIEYHRTRNIFPFNKHPTSTDDDQSASQCHFADQVYPVDTDCGMLHCHEHGIAQRLTLRYGWSAAYQTQLNRTAIQMLSYLDERYHKLPNTLQLIRDDSSLSNESDVAKAALMKYNNLSIALSSIRMHVEYFCCYETSVYQQIVQLFGAYEWQPFQIAFSEFVCLNVTYLESTMYVLMLDEESQEMMRQWTDAFEAYLVDNGVELLSMPRRDGQPFYVTFAVFDTYDKAMEVMSVETIDYLNIQNEDIEWESMSVTFSKENVKAD